MPFCWFCHEAAQLSFEFLFTVFDNVIMYVFCLHFISLLYEFRPPILNKIFSFDYIYIAVLLCLNPCFI